MRITNAQIKLLIPVVRREARNEPSRHWDDLLNSLVELAQKRGTLAILEHQTKAESEAAFVRTVTEDE